MLVPSLFAIAVPAAAQGLLTHHAVVPSAGIAAENGPGTLWVNPANMAYDPDPRLGVFFTRDALSEEATSVAMAGGAGGLSLGLHNQLRPVDDTAAPDGRFESDWSLDYGTSLALPERVSLGLMLSWNFVSGDAPNYLGYDVGFGWRPLPWLGLGGVAQNIGSPDPLGFAAPKTGGGVALRPLREVAVIGLDYARLFGASPDDPTADDDRLTATLRLRPVEGLYVRANLESRITDTVAPIGAGVGLEVFLDGFGVGGHFDTDLEAVGGQSLFVGTDEPGESLFRSGRRVPQLELDRAPPYQRRVGLFSDGPSWLDILELLRRVEDEPGVRGLSLELDGASMSLARCRELRERIVALEAKGRPVMVYLTGSPSNADYYVASAASKVALHPAADLDLVGLSVALQHLRGLLDLVGVEPQFVKRADYKTAPETFTEHEPTGANIEMTTALLDDLYGELVAAMASGRDVEPDVVKGWIDGGPHSAQEALDAHMVDLLLYPDEVEEALHEVHGGSVSTSKLLSMPQPHSAWEDPQQIAVVYIEGAIVPGRSSPGGLFSGRVTGSESIVEALDDARRDPLVEAVVLRVDSPGGSSFASDEIWRATERLGEAGKPLVVTMGGVAASGGYYVAAGADAIWAEPTTITGSIGVYSGKFTISDLQERLGVHTATLGRGRNAAIHSGATPWDDLQRARMQELVDHTYAQFKQRVLDGRPQLAAEELEEIARGRVWSGQRAFELKLVDGLGGFPEAIADARERAGIPERRKVGLVEFSSSGGVFQSLAPSISLRTTAGTWVASKLLGPLPELLQLRPREPVELAALRELVGPADQLLVPLLYPDVDVWAMEPFSLEIRTE